MKKSGFKAHAAIFGAAALLSNAAQLMSPQKAIAEVELSSLISLYDSGEYDTALTRLKAASKSGLKQNPTLHYYLARTYLMNRQLPLAKVEYAKAYALDQQGQIGKLSLDALVELERDPEKKKQLEETLSKLTIGRVGLSLHNSKVDYILPNGAASKTGIKLNDEIVSVDSIATKDLDSQSLTLLLRGDVGKSVHVTILRAGKNESFDLVRQILPGKAKDIGAKPGEKLTEISLNDNAEEAPEDAANKPIVVAIGPDEESLVPGVKEAKEATEARDAKEIKNSKEVSKDVRVEKEGQNGSEKAHKELTHVLDSDSKSNDDPVQLVMRAAALKAVAALQTGEIKEELLSKAKPLYEQALVLLNKHIAARPFDSNLYAMRAHVYDSNAEYQKGLDEYDFLKQFGIDNPLYVYARARDEDGLKHYQEAADDYLHYARMEEPKRAEREGRSFVGMSPIGAALNLPYGSASGFLGAAHDYVNLNENDKVIDVCNEGLVKNPDEPNLLLRRAEALFAQQSYAKALEDCNSAFAGEHAKFMFGLSLDTEVSAYALRAKIYRNLGRDREAAMDEDTCLIVSGNKEKKDSK